MDTGKLKMELLEIIARNITYADVGNSSDFFATYHKVKTSVQELLDILSTELPAVAEVLMQKQLKKDDKEK